MMALESMLDLAKPGSKLSIFSTPSQQQPQRRRVGNRIKMSRELMLRLSIALGSNVTNHQNYQANSQSSLRLNELDHRNGIRKDKSDSLVGEGGEKSARARPHATSGPQESSRKAPSQQQQAEAEAPAAVEADSAMPGRVQLVANKSYRLGKCD